MALDNSCVCGESPLEYSDPDGCKIMRLPKIARVVFQRVLSTNIFVGAVNGIEEAASWTGLADATDDTQIWTTGKLTELALGETAVRDGSENIDGATTANGVEAQLITGVIEDINPINAGVMNDLNCVGELGYYLVFADNSISSTLLVDSPAQNLGTLISDDTFSGSAPSREAGAGSKYRYNFQFKVNATHYQNSTNTKAEAGFSYINDLLPTP